MGSSYTSASHSGIRQPQWHTKCQVILSALAKHKHVTSPSLVLPKEVLQQLKCTAKLHSKMMKIPEDCKAATACHRRKQNTLVHNMEHLQAAHTCCLDSAKQSGALPVGPRPSSCVHIVTQTPCSC